jgi:hypothetical protein
VEDLRLEDRVGAGRRDAQWAGTAGIADCIEGGSTVLVHSATPWTIDRETSYHMVEDASTSGISARLGAVLLLVAINGFFVAAEFALVAVRRSRIDELAARGSAGARRVQTALKDLDRYISGTQLGITLASLGLGWIGEPALASLVDRASPPVGIPAGNAVAHSAAAIGIAFAVITFLHIVLGELAPKSLALVRPERVSIWVVRPLVLFSRVMAPFIWVLNGAASFLLASWACRPRPSRATCTRPRSSACSCCSRARTARSTRPTPRCWPASSTSTRSARAT